MLKVMGLDDVDLALIAFFNFFKETFDFNQKKSELRLKVITTKLPRSPLKVFPVTCTLKPPLNVVFHAKFYT